MLSKIPRSHEKLKCTICQSTLERRNMKVIFHPKDWEFHCSEDGRKRKRFDNMWKTRGSGETIGSSSKFAHLSVESIVGDVSTNSSIPIDEQAMAIVESEPSILPINQLNVSSISEPLASTTPLVIPPITSTSNIVSDSEFIFLLKS